MDEDRLWRAADLARYLKINEGTVRNWLSQGRLTAADGWVRISRRQNRFIPRVVKERVEAGMFTRGAGSPERRKLRSVIS